MNWEIRNIMCDIEVAKEKLEDVATAHGWFTDDVYTSNELETMREVKRYAYAYNEHRIQNNQMLDLMFMYLKDLNTYIGRFNDLVEQEKASRENFGEESRNA